eukprot:g32324.t1
MNYKERLEKLRLFSLERRRLRENMVEVYKIMRCIDRVDGQNLFLRAEMSKPREHAFKARGGKFKGDVRGKFFTQRVDVDITGKATISAIQLCALQGEPDKDRILKTARTVDVVNQKQKQKLLEKLSRSGSSCEEKSELMFQPMGSERMEMRKRQTSVQQEMPGSAQSQQGA